MSSFSWQATPPVPSPARWLPRRREGRSARLRSLPASEASPETECSACRGGFAFRALAERENNLRSIGVQAAPIVALSRPFEDPVPSQLAVEGVDLATLMFNYHDFGHLGVDRAARRARVARSSSRLLNRQLSLPVSTVMSSTDRLARSSSWRRRTRWAIRRRQDWW